MVLGRREVSAILLAIAAIVFYLVLLSTTPSGAQTGGGTTGGQSNGSCPGARVVDVTSGNGNKQTPVFNITGTSFRITISIEPSDVDPSLVGVTAWVTKPGGELVTSFAKDGFGTDSSVINEGPGRFFLDLNTANAQFTVTTEDCTATSQGGGGTQSNQGGSRQGRGGRSIINVPNKPLPPSGGLPVFLVAGGSVLTGVSLLTLGIAIRRRSRQ